MSESPREKDHEPGMMEGPVFEGADALLTALRKIGVQDTAANYFCLAARDIPEFPIFVTDAQGCGYAIIDCETTLYSGVEPAIGDISISISVGEILRCCYDACLPLTMFGTNASVCTVLAEMSME